MNELIYTILKYNKCSHIGKHSSKFNDNFNLNFQKEIVAKLYKQIKPFIHPTAGFIIIV